MNRPTVLQCFSPLGPSWGRSVAFMDVRVLGELLVQIAGYGTTLVGCRGGIRYVEGVQYWYLFNILNDHTIADHTIKDSKFGTIADHTIADHTITIWYLSRPYHRRFKILTEKAIN